jgi:heat shock protein HtpX
MVNQLKTIVLLGGLTALVVGIGSMLAPGSATLLLGLALLFNLGTYFFSDRLVLRMNRARAIGPEDEPGLHAMTAELAARAGIPMPRLYLMDDPSPNAFATGRNPAHGVVAVTTGLLQLMSARQIKGVVAHEIAHIKHRDILVASLAAALASMVSWVAQMFQFAAIFGGGSHDEDAPSPLAMLALAIVAPIAAMLVQLGISRSREYLADSLGARLTGDHASLASALVRLALGAERIPAHVQPATASLFIVNPLAGGGALMNLLSTHPPIAERVRRLRAMAARAQGVAVA